MEVVKLYFGKKWDHVSQFHYKKNIRNMILGYRTARKKNFVFSYLLCWIILPIEVLVRNEAMFHNFVIKKRARIWHWRLLASFRHLPIFPLFQCISPCNTCEWPSTVGQEMPEEIFSQIFKPGGSSIPISASQADRASAYEHYYNPLMRDDPQFQPYHNKRSVSFF